MEALYQSGTVKVLAVDGVTPSEANLRSGAYLFIICYWTVYCQDDEQTAAFVSWLTSGVGQRCVAQAGYMPYTSMDMKNLSMKSLDAT